MPFPETCISAAKVNESTIGLVPVAVGNLDTVLASLDPVQQTWVRSAGFDAGLGKAVLIAGKDGTVVKILVGTGDVLPSAATPWWLAESTDHFPEGDFYIDGDFSDDITELSALGWCLAHYHFDRYKSSNRSKKRRLVGLSESTSVTVKRAANAIATVRDLVNTPAEDMGPSDLQDAAEALAEAYGGTCATIVGDDLLDENLPAIHAVGRAAATGREPRLIDLHWGPDDAPMLTLVGKGVCFDTGGLNLKPNDGMRFMKKDMGGAAHVIGLAQLIMASNLNVKLRVLIAAVENSVSANAYRPGDVVATRKGLSVEIGNTDAEGRVVLCDALALASEERPDLLIDFATLTGAARVALGADLPATYTNDDKLWATLERAGTTCSDPLWRMPLWSPYDQLLSSTIADIGNVTDDGFAGSITAALYLQRFVGKNIPWVHFDVFAWNKRSRPGKPVGGEAQGLRATYYAIKEFLELR